MSSSATGETMLVSTGGKGNPAAPPALLTVIQHSMTSCLSFALTLRRVEVLTQRRNNTLGHTRSLADAYGDLGEPSSFAVVKAGLVMKNIKPTTGQRTRRVMRPTGRPYLPPTG